MREEVQEVEQAVASGVLHDVLAESIDVLYLAFNLLQECGLASNRACLFVEAWRQYEVRVLLILPGHGT